MMQINSSIQNRSSKQVISIKGVIKGHKSVGCTQVVGLQTYDYPGIVKGGYNNKLHSKPNYVQIIVSDRRNNHIDES